MWDLISDVELLLNEFEWALDNLQTVHTTMEDDTGANWEIRCNAVFSIYLQLCNIHERLIKRLTLAEQEMKAQTPPT